MDADAKAMKRRDDAEARGAKICWRCEGWGTIPVPQIGEMQCPKCNGETWIDKDGKPYKID